MGKEGVTDCLQQFYSAKTDNDIMKVFDSLSRLILCDVNDEIKQDNQLYQSIFLALTKIQESVQEKRMMYYIKTFCCIYSGDKNGYFKELEKYIIQYEKEKKEFEYENAYKNILRLIFYLTKDEETYKSYIKKLLSMLNTHMPESAFCAYVKYLSKTYQNQGSHINALQQILEIDKNWYAVHTHLGHIYYDQKKWQEAIECYELAISSGDVWKVDWIYFNLAWCYDKTKQYAKSAENYEKCLELKSDFAYANNNLGYAYKMIKNYEMALLYFDKSIALGTDGSYPIRNKLVTLIKAKRNDEAVAFAAENPTHFKSKYYRELLEKAGGQKIMEDISKELEKTTENENAGKKSIENGKSGINLYQHQKEAIKKMNEVILKDKEHAEYAGILVLPTGGGKTLTATYWLMQSILDKGYKIVWLAHRHELLNQANNSFFKVSFNEISKTITSYNWRIISGQHDKPVNIKPHDDIIISSKTSLAKGEKYFVDNWLKANGNKVFLIIDEAHHATASEYRKVINLVKDNTKNFKMLGLTATPFRTAENEQGLLKKLFPDDIVYNVNLKQLIERHILSQPIFKSIQTNIDMSELFRENDADEALERIINDSFFDIETIGKGIAKAIAENRTRNNAIVNEYVKNKHIYKQTLVFALNVDMAIALNALFNESGVRSAFVVSDIRDLVTGVNISSKENEDKIQKFRDGKLDVLVNVNILTEGTDLPMVQSVFLTRPTKSSILMTQMIGRALRGTEAGGTKEAYIVSFIDEWQDKIAWVNPETLLIGEEGFTEPNHEAQKQAMRLVSIAKIEEFAKIANGTIDERLSDLPFIDRIPIGIYNFKYLLESEYGDFDRTCDILVYDSMKSAYDELFEWLPATDLTDTKYAADHIDETLFGRLDFLLGYRKQDVIDIIEYYKQTGEVPQMIYLSERNDYDVRSLAKSIVDNDWGPTRQSQFIGENWENSDTKWSVFFGVNNLIAFEKLIEDAIRQILRPTSPPPQNTITQYEQRQIQDLPLYEIRQKFPELGEKIRNAVYDKFTDANGYYFSAKSGCKSPRKLDFEIDHIIPMSKGGKTVLDNLQLLTIRENKQKGDSDWRAYNVLY